MDQKEKPVTDERPVKQYYWQTESLKNDAKKTVRPGWRLLVPVIVLLVCALLWGMGTFDAPIPAKEPSPQPSAETVDLTGKIPDRFEVAIAGEERYVLVRDGESGVYKVDGMDYFTLDQDVVDTVFRRTADISCAVLTSDEGKPSPEFGLDEPWLTLVIDGICLRVGAGVPTQSAYYALRDGDTSMYTVPRATVSAIARPLRSLHIIPDDTGVNFDALEDVRLSLRDGETLAFTRASIADSPFVASFLMTEPYVYAAHAQRLSDALLPELENIAPCAYQAHLSSPEQAESYGLNEAWLTLSVADASGASAYIRVGDVYNEYRYLTVDDSGDVYLAKASIFDFVDDARSEYLSEQFVHLLRIDRVTQVNVTTRTSNVRFGISTDENEERTFKLNGRVVAQYEGRALYERLISVKHDKVCPDIAFEAEPVLMLEFQIDDGSVYTYQYLKWDEDYCAVRTSGETRFMVRSSVVDALIDEFDRLTDV